MEAGMIIFWTLFYGTCITFVYCGYHYFKKKGMAKTIIPIIFVNMGIFVMISISSNLVGSIPEYDSPLLFIKTFAFYLVPTLTTSYYIGDFGGIDKLLEKTKSIGG